MFIRLSTIVLSIAALAVASPGALEARTSNCDTGSIQCCNSVQSSSASAVTVLAGLLGIPLSDLTGQVGLTCTPITAVGVGSGSNCAAQPACCTGDSFNGLIVLGCTPINLSL